MDERLEEFSVRFSSQLCELERKLNIYIDLQQKRKKIVNELILPFIQALHRSINSISKKDGKSNDLAKLMNEVNYRVEEYYRLLDTNSQILPSSHLLSRSNVQ